MSWEHFPEWFRRRMRRFPYFGSWFFGDVDEMIKAMEEMMEREFKEFRTRVPKDLVREHKLPDGSTIREWALRLRLQYDCRSRWKTEDKGIWQHQTFA
ncbi:hypothetical protein KAI31_01935 [Candidatus Bathyarchaeota archaeon]|nr:hypothetical protein [Candidatus Bathyarchaeota archaeon]